MLPRSTRALLDLQWAVIPGAVLDIGSHDHALADALGCPYLHVDLTACRSLAEHSDRLPAGTFTTVLFDARTYDPSLAVELLGQIAQQLAPDGLLITTARPTDVDRLFSVVQAHGEALIARAPRPAAPQPAWPTFTVLFQDQSLAIQSAPGIFAPRALDEGTRVMLEVITAERGARFLDLGCGAGVVSKIATEVWGCTVTAVDVNARALRITALNAPQAEVLPSDGFGAILGRTFDVIASNPPYHTDYAVGKAFVEGAHAHLTLGGTLYLVVKRADWYEQKVRTIFGGCRLIVEGGYTVIVASKRAPRPVAPKAPTMTKKHAKRIGARAK
jgi:16S rRNA (guanine1207-N2)-methyltransferase